MFQLIKLDMMREKGMIKEIRTARRSEKVFGSNKKYVKIENWTILRHLGNFCKFS